MTQKLRSFARWTEEDGSVLWWRFPIEEPPYVGSPLDLGFSVGAELLNQFGDVIGTAQGNVGGWPFLDEDDGTLFWQPLDVPADPRP